MCDQCRSSALLSVSEKQVEPRFVSHETAMLEGYLPLTVHHEKVWESTERGGIIGFRTSKFIPVFRGGLAPPANQFHATQEMVGLETVRQHDHVRFNKASLRAHSVRQDLNNLVVGQRQVLRVEAFHVARVEDAALAADLKVWDQQIVVFSRRSLPDVRFGNLLPPFPKSPPRFGHGECLGLAFREEVDGEAQDEVGPRNISKHPLSHRSDGPVERRKDPVLGADDLGEVLCLAENIGYNLNSGAAVTKQDDPLAGQVHIVIPAGGVYDGPGKALSAGNIKPAWVHQQTCPGEEELTLMEEFSS